MSWPGRRRMRTLDSGSSSVTWAMAREKLATGTRWRTCCLEGWCMPRAPSNRTTKSSTSSASACGACRCGRYRTCSTAAPEATEPVQVPEAEPVSILSFVGAK
uniref:(northern house mosquito) hypothetical protein n=1 Tax=Culex pipiens TaxID=7175 RepID=A0A8D8EW48_CULPI